MARQPELGIKVRVDPVVKSDDLKQKIQEQVDKVNELPKIKIQPDVEDFGKRLATQIKANLDVVNKILRRYTAKLSKSSEELSQATSMLFGIKAPENTNQIAEKIQEQAETVKKAVKVVQDEYSKYGKALNQFFESPNIGDRNKIYDDDDDSVVKYELKSIKSIQSVFKAYEKVIKQYEDVRNNSDLQDNFIDDLMTRDGDPSTITKYLEDISSIFDLLSGIKSKDDVPGLNAKEFLDFKNAISSAREEFGKLYEDINNKVFVDFNLDPDNLYPILENSVKVLDAFYEKLQTTKKVAETVTVPAMGTEVPNEKQTKKANVTDQDLGSSYIQKSLTIVTSLGKITSAQKSWNVAKATTVKLEELLGNRIEANVKKVQEDVQRYKELAKELKQLKEETGSKREPEDQKPKVNLEELKNLFGEETAKKIAGKQGETIQGATLNVDPTEARKTVEDLISDFNKKKIEIKTNVDTKKAEENFAKFNKTLNQEAVVIDGFKTGVVDELTAAFDRQAAAITSVGDKISEYSSVAKGVAEAVVSSDKAKPDDAKKKKSAAEVVEPKTIAVEVPNQSIDSVNKKIEKVLSKVTVNIDLKLSQKQLDDIKQRIKEALASVSSVEVDYAEITQKLFGNVDTSTIGKKISQAIKSSTEAMSRNGFSAEKLATSISATGTAEQYLASEAENATQMLKEQSELFKELGESAKLYLDAVNKGATGAAIATQKADKKQKELEKRKSMPISEQIRTLMGNPDNEQTPIWAEIAFRTLNTEANKLVAKVKELETLKPDAARDYIATTREQLTDLVSNLSTLKTIIGNSGLAGDLDQDFSTISLAADAAFRSFERAEARLQDKIRNDTTASNEKLATQSRKLFDEIVAENAKIADEANRIDTSKLRELVALTEEAAKAETTNPLYDGEKTTAVYDKVLTEYVSVNEQIQNAIENERALAAEAANSRKTQEESLIAQKQAENDFSSAVNNYVRRLYEQYDIQKKINELSEKGSDPSAIDKQKRALEEVNQELEKSAKTLTDLGVSDTSQITEVAEAQARISANRSADIAKRAADEYAARKASQEKETRDSVKEYKKYIAEREKAVVAQIKEEERVRAEAIAAEARAREKAALAQQNAETEHDVQAFNLTLEQLYSVISKINETELIDPDNIAKLNELEDKASSLRTQLEVLAGRSGARTTSAQDSAIFSASNKLLAGLNKSDSDLAAKMAKENADALKAEAEHDAEVAAQRRETQAELAAAEEERQGKIQKMFELNAQIAKLERDILLSQTDSGNVTDKTAAKVAEMEAELERVRDLYNEIVFAQGMFYERSDEQIAQFNLQEQNQRELIDLIRVNREVRQEEAEASKKAAEESARQAELEKSMKAAAKNSLDDLIGKQREYYSIQKKSLKAGTEETATQKERLQYLEGEIKTLESSTLHGKYTDYLKPEDIERYKELIKSLEYSLNEAIGSAIDSENDKIVAAAKTALTKTVSEAKTALSEASKYASRMVGQDPNGPTYLGNLELLQERIAAYEQLRAIIPATSNEALELDKLEEKANRELGTSVDSLVEKKSKVVEKTSEEIQLLNSLTQTSIQLGTRLKDLEGKNAGDTVEYSNLNKVYSLYNDLIGVMQTPDGDFNAWVAQNAQSISEFADIDVSKIANSADAVKALQISARNALGPVGELLKILTANNGMQQASTRVANLQSNIADYLAENKRIAGDADIYGRFTSLLNELRSPDAARNVGQLTGQFARLRQECKELGLEGDNLITKFSDLFGKHFGTLLIMSIIHNMRTGLRQVYQNVVDIDSAMTQLRIVTNANDDAMRSYANNAAAAAREVGASITDIAKSTETYARLGNSLEDSLAMAKATAIFSNVGDIDQSAATSGLTAIMKAFGYAADQLEGITDRIILVSRDFPIDAKGIAAAMENGGASLQAAGNTLNESLALVAAGNAATQDASSVGNAMKSITARIRTSKADLENLGEEYNEVTESASKYRAELMQLTKTKGNDFKGVDIFADDGSYKSTYQVLLEIAQVYDQISDKNRAALLEDLGGKRNSAIVQSILQNADILVEAYEEAENAAGTTAEANAMYMDSINGKVAQFTATFQELSNDVLDSDLVKGIVDIGTAFLGVADGLAKVDAFWPSVAAGFTLFKSADVFKSGKVQVEEFFNALNDTDASVISIVKSFSKLGKVTQGTIFAAGDDIKNRFKGMAVDVSTLAAQYADLSEKEKNVFDSLIPLGEAEKWHVHEQAELISSGQAISGLYVERALASSNLDSAIQKQILHETGLVAAEGQYGIAANSNISAVLKQSEAFKNLHSEQKDEILSLFAVESATVSLTGAQKALAVASSAARTLMMSFVSGIVIFAIQKAWEWVKNLKFGVDALDESLKKANETYKETQSEVSELTNKIKDVSDEIDRLNGKNIKDPADNIDLEKLKETKNILEAQLRVEEALAEQQKGTVNKAAYARGDAKLYNSLNDTEEILLDESVLGDQFKTPVAKTAEVAAKITDVEYIDELKDRYAELHSEMVQLAEDQGNLTTEEYQERYEALDAQLIETANTIKTVGNEIKDYIGTVTDGDAEWVGERTDALNVVADIVESENRRLGILKETASIADIVYDKELVEEYRAAAYELYKAEEGKESLWEARSKLNQKWRELKILADEAGISVQEYNRNALELKNVSYVVDAEAEKWKELNTQIDNIQNVYKVGADALAEYNENGFITIDTLQNLLNLGQDNLAYLVDENGQLALNSESLINLANARLDDMKAKALEDSINLIQSFTDEAKAASYLGESLEESANGRIDDAKAAVEEAKAATLAQVSAENYLTVLAAIDKAIAVYKGVSQQIENVRAGLGKNTAATMGYKGATDKSNKSTDKAKEKTTDLATAYKTLLAAQEEYNQYGGMTLGTVEDLMGLENKYTDLLQKNGKQLEINKEKLQKLLKAELDKIKTDDEANKKTDEMKRLLKFISAYSSDATLSLNELRDAIEGVGSAFKDTSEKINTAKTDFEAMLEAVRMQAKHGGIDLDTSLKLREIEIRSGVKLLDKDGGLDTWDGASFEANYKKKFTEYAEAAKAAAKEGSEDWNYWNNILDTITNKTGAEFEDWVRGMGTVVGEMTDKLSGLRSAYETLRTAQDEYNLKGFISIENIEKLAELDNEFVDVLVDEHGQIVLNGQAYQDATVKMLRNLREKLEAEGKNEKLLLLIDSTIEQITDDTYKWANATGELKDAVDYLGDVLAKFKEVFDAVADDRIKKLQKQKEELEKSNDEQERAIKLAELEDNLAKARANRNIRQFVEGQGYIWTVDEKAIQEAEKALSDQKKEWDLSDQKQAIDDEIDGLQKVKDNIGDAISLFTQFTNGIKEAISFMDMLKNLSGERGLLGGLRQLADYIWNGLDFAFGGFIANIKDGIGQIGQKIAESKVGESIATGAGKVVSAVAQGAGKVVTGIVGGKLVDMAGAALGSVFGPIGTAIGGSISKIWNIGKRFLGFASGTKKVEKPGTYNVDEQGPEVIVRKPEAGRYTYLEDGDGVIPADITKRLFEMGGDPQGWLSKQLAISGLDKIQTVDKGGNDYSVSVGQIIINKPVGDVDALARRINQELPNKIRQQQGKR